MKMYYHFILGDERKKMSRDKAIGKLDRLIRDTKDEELKDKLRNLKRGANWYTAEGILKMIDKILLLGKHNYKGNVN